jgi:hypothetical protein
MRKLAVFPAPLIGAESLMDSAQAATFRKKSGIADVDIVFLL